MQRGLSPNTQQKKTARHASLVRYPHRISRRIHSLVRRNRSTTRFSFDVSFAHQPNAGLSHSREKKNPHNYRSVSVAFLRLPATNERKKKIE